MSKKSTLFASLFVLPVVASAGILDHPQLRVKINTPWGDIYDSGTPAGKAEIKRYITALPERARDKALEYITAYYNGIQTAEAQAAIKDMNAYCKRSDSRATAFLDFNVATCKQGAYTSAFAYDTRLTAIGQASASRCLYQYDANYSSEGKYGSMCLGQSEYFTDAVSSEFIAWAANLVKTDAKKKDAAAAKLDQVLGGSN